MDRKVSFPRAAGGLFILFAASVVSNVGNQLYSWGIAPAMGLLIMSAGSILLAVGLYRAGADEPGFYRALLYAAVSMGVSWMSGCLQMEFYYAGLLLYGAAPLLSLYAANLACAAASRLLRLAGREPLAFLGGVVVKLNIVCYAAAIVGMLALSMGIGLSYALLIISWLLTVVYLAFLFKAGRALWAGRD